MRMNELSAVPLLPDLSVSMFPSNKILTDILDLSLLESPGMCVKL